MLSVQDRFYALMDYYKRPKTEFAKAIGTTLNNLSVYYHRDKISKEILKRILTCFPEVNRRWLEEGEGPMLNQDIEVSRDNSELFAEKPLERVTMFVPGIRVDAFIRVLGFSMPPSICNGDVIGVVVQDFGCVETSKPYLFLMSDGTYMIRLIVGVSETAFSITADKSQKKEPQTLSKDNVRGIYKIVYLGKIF